MLFIKLMFYIAANEHIHVISLALFSLYILSTNAYLILIEVFALLRFDIQSVFQNSVLIGQPTYLFSVSKFCLIFLKNFIIGFVCSNEG